MKYVLTIFFVSLCLFAHAQTPSGMSRMGSQLDSARRSHVNSVICYSATTACILVGVAIPPNYLNGAHKADYTMNYFVYGIGGVFAIAGYISEQKAWGHIGKAGRLSFNQNGLTLSLCKVKRT